MRIFGAPFAFSVAGFACVATETSPRDVSTTPPFACFFIAGAFLGAEALAAVFFGDADIEWRGERAETWDVLGAPPGRPPQKNYLKIFVTTPAPTTRPPR